MNLCANQKKDLFGHTENQGKNYELSRPTYPQIFLEIILKNLVDRENYLDVACGTGQLYYNLQQYFSGIRSGADISKVMIEQANAKLIDKNDPNLNFFLVDSLIVGQTISDHYGKQIKFDLITIGQALHWLEVEKFFQYVVNNLMKSENSALAILSYFPTEIILDVEQLRQQEDQSNILFTQDLNEIEKQFQLYNKIFYNKVKGKIFITGYFDCDRENLRNHYRDYDFMNKYFSRIQYKQQIENHKQSLSQFINQLKSFSGYNTYLQVNNDDPVQELKDKLTELYQDLVEKYQLKTKTIPLIFKHDYFMYICQK